MTQICQHAAVLRFTKYHGLGNDFLVVDRRHGGESLEPSVVRTLCDRHRGVGADGVLSVWEDAEADARMQVQNADGSESEMCGNGLRCVARYLYDSGAVDANEPVVMLAAGSGRYRCERLGPDKFRVDMGAPVLEHPELPRTARVDGAVCLEAAGRRFDATAVHMGNPHAVIFVEPEDGVGLRELAVAVGPGLERHPGFVRRTNVELARPTQDGYEVVVHERGVGITEACGSGACAVGVAAVLRGLVRPGQPMAMHLPGGLLAICVDSSDSGMAVTMEGEAMPVFEGSIVEDRT